MTRAPRQLLIALAVTVTVACAVLDAPTGGLTVWLYLLLASLGVLIVVRRGAGAPGMPAPAASVTPLSVTPTRQELLREGLVLGLTGFGGGLAVLSQIEHRLVRRHRWISDETFLESAALAQSLPGAVAFNALAFIGRRLAGLGGAVLMAAGFVLPAFLLLLAFALLYTRLRHLVLVDGLFNALNPAVAGLVGATAVRLAGRAALTESGEPGGWRWLVQERWTLAMVAATAVAVGVFGFGVVEVLVGAGLVGLARHVGPGRRFIDTVEVRWRWLRWRIWVAAQSDTPATRRWWRRRIDEDELMAVTPGLLLLGPAFATALERFQVFGSLSGIFLRAGSLTFGGGFVMIPLLEAELVQARGWLSPQAFADAMALGQITPGPVVITSAFVGYQIGGLAGALLSTVSVFLPAFVLVLIVGSSIERFRQSVSVQAFLQGLQPAVVGVMLAAAVSLARNGIHDVFGATIALVAFALLWRWRLNPMWVVLGACVVGVIESQTRQWFM